MANQLELIPLDQYHDDSLEVVEKIEIWQDQIPSSPREWDNLSEMVIRKVMDFRGDRQVCDDQMQALITRCKGLPDWESGNGSTRQNFNHLPISTSKILLFGFLFTLLSILVFGSQPPQALMAIPVSGIRLSLGLSMSRTTK
jgi:hypothetical protein